MSARIENASEPVKNSRGRRWRMPWATAVIAFVAFIGVLVMLYPSVASWYSQYEQSKLIGEIDRVVEAGPDTKLEQELQRAHNYNDALTGGALVAANTNVPEGQGVGASDFDYSSLLQASSTGIMGRLKIAAINVDLPIYHGTSDDTLAKGVGHLEGTALPVGGESMHPVLTAHRGLPSADLFTHLDQVKKGDTFVIEVFGEVLTYKVIKTQVVQPEETKELFPEYGKDLVTLVTCTPLGINSHRILVTGERVTPTPINDVKNAGASPDIPGFPWWAVGIGGAVALLTLYVWRMGRVTPVARRTATKRGWGIYSPDQDSAPEPGIAAQERPEA